MFDAFLAYQARARPRALALITPRRRATYAELDADVNRFAAGLVALGVTPARGIVAVETLGAYHKHVLLLALARLAIPTTGLDDPRADLRLSQRPGETDERTLRLSRDWFTATEAAPPRVVAPAPRDPNGLARVMLSSGTTRTPKRVPLTWARVEANALNGMGLYGGGRLGVWVLRTGIDSGLGYMLATLAWTIGAAAAADFGTEDLPGLLEREQPGLIGLTPMQLRGLLAALPAGFALKPEWRVVVTGGLLPASVAREARRRLTPDIQIVYGATESGRVATGPAAALETTPGAVGWPLPGVEVQIVDAEGRPVPDGEQGEIRVRSDRLAGAYLDDEDAGAQVFRDGWCHPGDLGRRLPDGTLVVDGRVDERMNIGGMKVMPNVLEDAAQDHPAVVDCAVFGLKDAQGREECWMAVVPGEGLTRKALITHMARGGARMPPMRIAWTETIPRNAMGKVERAALRTQVAEALASPGGAEPA